jgi:hypothetical protein
MFDQPNDDSGGLTPDDDLCLEVWLRFAALTPEQSRRVTEWIEADRAYRDGEVLSPEQQRCLAEWARAEREYRAGMS